MRPLNALIISMGVLAAPVFAQTSKPCPSPAGITVDQAMTRGQQASKANSAPDAICWFTIAADKGNVDAMKALADIYHYMKNYDETRNWLLAAANHGDTKAMQNLGILAQEQHNQAAAERWYRNAIENGDVDAYYNLGVLQVAQEAYPAALNSFIQAAQKGNASAEYNISIMTARGLGTPKNIPEAVNWMQRSAKHGSPQAAAILKTATEQAQKAPPVKTASAAAAPTVQQNTLLQSVFSMALQSMMREPTAEDFANEKAQKDKDYDEFMREREDCISAGGNSLGPCIRH